MKIPSYGNIGRIAILAAAIGLSGCVTDGYDRAYGSVSIGTGWYDGYYYPGYYDYYPGYYRHGYGYYDYPYHYYHRPRYKGHRHRDRHDGRPSGHLQGKPSHDSRPGKVDRPRVNDGVRAGRWQGRGDMVQRGRTAPRAETVRPRESSGGRAGGWQGRGGGGERNWIAPRQHVRERK